MKTLAALRYETKVIVSPFSLDFSFPSCSQFFVVPVCSDDVQNHRRYESTWACQMSFSFIIFCCIWIILIHASCSCQALKIPSFTSSFSSHEMNFQSYLNNKSVCLSLNFTYSCYQILLTSNRRMWSTSSCSVSGEISYFQPISFQTASHLS